MWFPIKTGMNVTDNCRLPGNFEKVFHRSMPKADGKCPLNRKRTAGKLFEQCIIINLCVICIRRLVIYNAEVFLIWNSLNAFLLQVTLFIALIYGYFESTTN